MAKSLVALVCLGLVLIGAAGPAAAQPVGTAPSDMVMPPSATTGISPDGATKVVEIMTGYTMAVGAGFAGAGLVASLITNRTTLVLLSGVVGAVIGNVLYAQELRRLYGRPLGEN